MSGTTRASAGARKQPGEGSVRERANYAIHKLYVRHEFDDCLSLIEEQLKQWGGQCEYPIYIKGLIRRQQGKIEESLQLFQAATVLNPQSTANLKQVGRSLYLLGKHRQAVEVYEEALRLCDERGEEDWELHHNKGLCLMYLREFEEAAECFVSANEIHPHDSTFMQLGKVYTLQDKLQEAIDIYLEALDFSPENPELLTTLGLLYLRFFLASNGDQEMKFTAFQHLGNALTFNPRDPKSILAAGYVMQDNNDTEYALNKYRVAAVMTPSSPQLWNNIGMCFYSQGNMIAAIACLKRALYLDPFEWIIAYNLGLAHLRREQYASAFHYLSASINLKSDFAHSYMYLAIALTHLQDFDNARNAYEKALELENHHIFHMNYAISLINHGEKQKAALHYSKFCQLWEKVDSDAQAAEPEVDEMRHELERKLQQQQA